MPESTTLYPGAYYTYTPFYRWIDNNNEAIVLRNVKNVVDGDTVDDHFNIYGLQRVRLVGINTPEIGEEGYDFFFVRPSKSN
ncbi:MAG: hypothetical protein IMF19_15945 [Proteobacteria bacterium]|nr:hypothetical protein [Pseudomonadota bacterium]